MNGAVVGVEVDGAVASIELRRPERRNAVNRDLSDALERTVEEVNDDEAIRAVVLAGAGPSFCAGADMKERLASPERSAQVFRAVRQASRAVHRLQVPAVAAVHGHALGAGLELAAMCDYRVAEEGAVLGLPEVAQGITSGGGILALASLIPRGTLAKLAFTAEKLDATQAHDLGVVEELVAAGGARSRAHELAAGFARHPRAALVAAKTALLTVTEPTYAQQWQLLGLLQQTLEGGPAQQAVLSRLRRRGQG